MFRALDNRFGHYLLLTAVASLLFFPNLGVPSLWDIDEGHNVEAAREMWVSNNWIIPRFNYVLRVDKPVLLYWLQLAAFNAFGINEFAGRFPSALAALLTVLLTYELGRRLFDQTTGLLSGIILASTLLFCGSAHFANPDALLISSTVLTFLFFWSSHSRGGTGWLALTGLSSGLGFLAKGPVALVLPTAIIVLYLLWNHPYSLFLDPRVLLGILIHPRLLCGHLWQSFVSFRPQSLLDWVGRHLRVLIHPHLLLGCLLWGLVAVPWFALVGSETKGEYLRGFFITHNYQRYTGAMEGHSGSVLYHCASLFLGFMPWAVFLLPALGNGLRQVWKVGPNSPQLRFLTCWISVWFVFFSISQTKLPNYLLPLYPAVALLTAQFLQQWRRGEIALPDWAFSGSLAGWAMVGVGTTAALVMLAGIVVFPPLHGRIYPGLANVAWLGLLPALGAVAGWWLLQCRMRGAMLASLAITAVLFVAGLATWGAPAIDAYKAPRSLVQTAEARQPYEEVRVACYQWYQPSLVFYCGREVVRLNNDQDARWFLDAPLPGYLFLPTKDWERLETKVNGSFHLAARHWDMYRNCEVVVITNRPAEVAQKSHTQRMPAE